LLFDVVLIDGNNLAHRVFSAQKGLKTSEGESVGLIFGFLQNVFSLKKNWLRYRSEIYVAWDRGSAYRTGIYEDYKGNRRAKRDDNDQEYLDFISQKRKLTGILPKIGVSQVYKDGEEADDVIGTLAKRFEEKGKSVLIFSNDHDFFQLLSEKVSMVRRASDKRGLELFDQDCFMREFGISASRYLDVMSLMGDSGDNIPGIMGIGEKTAVKIVGNNPDLVTAILNESDSVGVSGVTERIANLVKTNFDKVRFASKLVRIRCDLEELKTIEPQKDMTAVRGIFHDLEFKQFLRIHNWQLLEDI
jgi:DNA polymerase-1